MIGLGMVSFAAAELYYTIALEPLGDDIPYPSLADALYLGLYPCCFAGLLLLARCRAGRLPWMLWVDGLIVALGFAAVARRARLRPRARRHRRRPADGRHQPRLPDRRRPAARARRRPARRLRPARPGARGRRSSAASRCSASRTRSTSARRARQLRGRRRARRRLARRHGARRCGGLAAAPRRLDARARRRPRLPPRPAGRRRCRARAAACSTTTTGSTDRGRGRPPAACSPSSCALGGTFRENGRMLRASRDEAATDALTGLGNRRALIADLERRLAADEPEPAVLALFDLDGFKAYNDTFGHPAGDRCSSASARSLAGDRRPRRRLPHGRRRVLRAARPPARERRPSSAAPRAALSEHGEGFTVAPRAGTVALPGEARRRLRGAAIADQRMYAHKRGGRTSAEQPVHDVLLQRARTSASPTSATTCGDVAAARRARSPAASGSTSTMVARASASGAELHDIGKLAIPDAILNKPGPLDDGRVGLHAPPHADRRAHPRRRAGAAPSRAARAREPRALGRRRLPRRPRRRARSRSARAIDRGLRRLRRDDHRPPVPRARCATRTRSPSSSAARARQFDPAVVDAFRAVLAPPRRHLQALA